jgi:glycosyltransferase involved in cell wall biosynthesis
MRILVITPGFLPYIGGAEVITHDIYSRLGARHQVTILTREMPLQEAPEGFDTSKYQVWRYKDWLNFGRIGGRMLLRGIVPPFSFGATIASIRAIQKLKPDIVNVTYAIYTGLGAIWASKIAQIPTVLSLLGRDAAPGPLTPYCWPRYANWIARQMTYTTFVSAYCRNFHQNIRGRSSVIFNGVDIQKFKYRPRDELLRQELALQPNSRVLFALQRLDPIKRVDMALKALRNLLEQGHTNCVLVVGGAGRQFNSLQNLADTLGVKDNVRFTGFIPESELPRYFSIAEIFVMTSDYETFGIVLAQALATGVPVASINNTAIPEVVQDGVTGLLSTPGDDIELARNIHRLLSEKDLHEKMTHQARTHAEVNFDIDQIALKYESLFLNLVESN